MAENNKKSDKVETKTAKPVSRNKTPNEIEYEIHGHGVDFRVRIVSYDEPTLRICARAEIMAEKAKEMGKKKKVDVNYN